MTMFFLFSSVMTMYRGSEGMIGCRNSLTILYVLISRMSIAFYKHFWALHSLSSALTCLL